MRIFVIIIANMQEREKKILSATQSGKMDAVHWMLSGGNDEIGRT